MLLLAVLIVIGIFYPDIKHHGIKAAYPTKYSHLVEKYAEKYNIQESLVYAVIKTESGFDPDAESHAGAKGLMQMTDETFSWMQQEIDGEVKYEPDRLFEPEISIKYGCALLSKLLNYYESYQLALCAYNAGMGNVSQWIELYGDGNGGLTEVPFPETESYIVKVLEAQKVYREVYSLD